MVGHKVYYTRMNRLPSFILNEKNKWEASPMEEKWKTSTGREPRLLIQSVSG